MLTVIHDLPVFVVVKGAVLQKDEIRRLELADIMEKTCYLEVFQFLPGKTHSLTDLDGQFCNPRGMASV